MKPIILFDNRFLDGTITATSEATGFPVANIVDLRTYTFFKANAAGTCYLTVDCGAAKSADALGIISHNLKTANASIAVESSNDNFTANIIERLAPFTPASDKSFMKLFTSASDRYWRIKIVTASIAAQIAVVMLGQRLTFERHIYGELFDPAPEKIEAESSTGKTGHLLGSIVKYTQYGIDTEWKNLTDTWVRNTFKPAWDAHISKFYPYFFAWDIDRFADDVFFVVYGGNGLSMPYNPIRRNLKLTMIGVKEE